MEHNAIGKWLFQISLDMDDFNDVFLIRWHYGWKIFPHVVQNIESLEFKICSSPTNLINNMYVLYQQTEPIQTCAVSLKVINGRWISVALFTNMV